MNRTTKTNKPLEVDTVIVGAGVTGISTALHLLDRNYKDFLIVEAQDYIGGRCQTYDLGNLLRLLRINFKFIKINNLLFKITDF